MKCTTNDGMVVKADPLKRKIGFSVDVKWGSRAKTGVIPCQEGFEIQVSLKVPYPTYNNW